MQGSQKVSSMDVQLYGKENTNNDGQRPVFLDAGEICSEVIFILWIFTDHLEIQVYVIDYTYSHKVVIYQKR